MSFMDMLNVCLLKHLLLALVIAKDIKHKDYCSDPVGLWLFPTAAGRAVNSPGSCSPGDKV